MDHSVDYVVDAELERLVGEVHRPVGVARPLPVVADVVVVVGDHHQAPVGVVVLEESVVHGDEIRTPDVLEVERLDVEEGIEDGVRDVELHRRVAGEDALHLDEEVVELAGLHEVVHHQEPALEQPGPQVLGFLIARVPEPDFTQVGEGAPEEGGLVERVDVAAALVERERGVFPQDAGEVLLAPRIVVVPLQVEPPVERPPAVARRLETDPGEGEAVAVGVVVVFEGEFHRVRVGPEGRGEREPVPGPRGVGRRPLQPAGREEDRAEGAQPDPGGGDARRRPPSAAGRPGP